VIFHMRRSGLGSPTVSILIAPDFPSGYEYSHGSRDYSEGLTEPPILTDSPSPADGPSIESRHHRVLDFSSDLLLSSE